MFLKLILGSSQLLSFKSQSVYQPFHKFGFTPGWYTLKRGACGVESLNPGWSWATPQTGGWGVGAPYFA